MPPPALCRMFSWAYAPSSRQNLSEHPPYGANAGQPTVKLGTQLQRHAIQLRPAGRLPGNQPVLEAGSIESISFPREPGEIFEATFGLKPINARDAASDGMEDCFDFAQRALGPPK